jgi:hypothetical protein
MIAEVASYARMRFRTQTNLETKKRREMIFSTRRDLIFERFTGSQPLNCAVPASNGPHQASPRRQRDGDHIYAS